MFMCLYYRSGVVIELVLFIQITFKMALLRYKNLISNRIVDILKKSNCIPEVNPCLIEPFLSLNSNNRGSCIQLQLSCNELQHHFNHIREQDLQNLIEYSKNDDIINNVGHKHKEDGDFILFDINKDRFLEDVLNDKEYYWRLENPVIDKAKGKLVIDFSSPNVAKPFHMGHFRSTIIGNYISNIYEYRCYDVVRLTYLGDWGTQFGLLQVGLDNLGLTDKDLSENPTEIMFNAYVTANKESETNPSILSKAKEIFYSMELGNNDSVLEKWKTIRKFTTEELKYTYDRLGVNFDFYDWESNYPANIAMPIINILKDKKCIHHENGKVIFKSKSGSKVTVLKSDGTSLYLTRDILAALDRKSRFNFDKMLYVTDFSQEDHFKSLDEILNSLDGDWKNRIQHIKYGRIRGMSTRKGDVIFLKDILDEAKDRMREKQKETSTTKSDLDDKTSDIIGMSAVIVNDLRQRRLRDYQFNWDNALQMKGNSGVKLQYTHCRLVSLKEENLGIPRIIECDLKYLQEPEVVNLVREIARFEEIIEISFKKLEAYFVVYYLLDLCDAINRALEVLSVKKASNVDLAAQRLLVFNCAKIVLKRGMKLLGLKPLKRM